MNAINQWKVQSEVGRNLRKSTFEVYLKHLEQNELSDEERKKLVKHIRDMLELSAEREADDRECSKIVGEIKGMWEGAGAVLGGMVVGSFIQKLMKRKS